MNQIRPNELLLILQHLSNLKTIIDLLQIKLLRAKKSYYSSTPFPFLVKKFLQIN